MKAATEIPNILGNKLKLVSLLKTVATMKNLKSALISVVPGMVLFLSNEPALAANFRVQMSDFAFTPSTLTIGVGDTVTWTNVTTGVGTHTATSSTSASSCTPNQFWNSGNLPPNGGGTYTFTFTNFAPGTYPYICSNHCAQFNMKGTLIITNAANVPPSVTITNPTADTVFAAPANVTIQATATDTDGSVTNVEFLVGSTVLTNVTAPPYAATTNDLPAGNYTLSAIASDNGGAKKTNSVNIIVDALPSVSITNPAANAKFRAPANIALMTDANDTDGSVTNVQFFSGASLLGGTVIAPYDFTVSNVPAGNYSFTAKAVDNRGLATTSGVVNLFVFTNAILTSPVQLPDGQFQLTILGISGQTYATEASTNLQDWTSLTTNVAPANSFDITDSTSTNILQRFYRARQDL